MFLLIVITIIATGALIVGALYSSILPFFSVIGNTANYNIAYYGAIGSTERALLSLRYHKAGYEGRGGFSGSSAVSGVITDIITGGFGSITRNNNGMQRTITSLSSGSIPAASGGDIERLLKGTGSSDFNMLGYDGLIQLPLYKDISLSPLQRYTTGLVATITATNGLYIEGTLRLPPKVLGALGGGSSYTLDSSTDIDGDSIYDDIVVNRGLKGTNLAVNQSFSIIPTIKGDYNSQTPIYDFENAIRETHINNVSDAAGSNTPNFFMGNPGGFYEFNIILQPTIALSQLTGHIAIPANNLVVDPASGFTQILNDSNLKEPSISLNLVNKLVSTSIPVGHVFPFLEYQLKVCETGVGCNVPVSDRYFRIDAAGTIGEYDVHIRLNKSVIDKGNTADFTIVF